MISWSSSLLAVSDMSPQELLLRLGVAAILGLFLGIEREKPHRAAGMRTHVLVALGSAMFVLATMNIGGSSDSISRVIQGVVQGIGFLGAGTILKLTNKVEVRGLTTAASVWVTASIGVAAALGEYWIAIFGTAIAWFALWPLRLLEEAVFPDDKKQGKQRKAIAAGGGKPNPAADDEA